MKKDVVTESIVYKPLESSGYVLLSRTSKRKFKRRICINDNISPETAAKVINWARQFRRKFFIKRFFLNNV